jgi:2'-5' RNA ligase
MKRLFIAIEIPKKLKEQITTELIAPLENVKKVSEENLHITLCFIGDTSEEREKQIIKVLEKIEFKKFNSLVGGVGHFNERVLWLSIESIQLYELAEQISKTLIIDNEFNGHITIARTTDSTDFKKEFTKIRGKKINQTLKVKSFFLIESKPTKEGSIYSKVKEFKVKN